MLRSTVPRVQAFIGDDLIIQAHFRCESLDITPYTITSELRDGGGFGDVVSTLSVVKNPVSADGQTFGFKATAPSTDTSLLTSDGDYALDFKFSLNGQVQHSQRLAVEFLRRVTA